MLARLPLVLVIAAVAEAATAGASTNGTRLLRTPTVSATQIAFAYANNIWIVDRNGGVARRLTSFQGQTTNPIFRGSPTARNTRATSMCT